MNETILVDGKKKPLLTVAELNKLPIGTMLGKYEGGRNVYVILHVDGNTIFAIDMWNNEIEELDADYHDECFFKEGKIIRAAWCRRSDGIPGSLHKTTEGEWRLNAGCNTISRPTLAALKEEALETWSDYHGTTQDDAGTTAAEFKRFIKAGGVDMKRVELNRETRRLINRMFSQITSKPKAKATGVKKKAAKKASARRRAR